MENRFVVKKGTQIKIEKNKLKKEGIYRKSQPKKKPIKKKCDL